MSKINLSSILKKVSRSRAVKRKVEKTFTRRFEAAKAQTLDNFDSHPVTKELTAGATSSNTSGTLGGYGNLFSFIGFKKSGNPTSELRRVIGEAISFRAMGSLEKAHAKRIIFKYKISTPSQEKIRAATPMPWEGGSWVDGIENGMSNFSYYMYKKFTEGRSGWGLQADHELRKAIFTPKDYTTGILETFKREVRTP